MEKDEEKQRVPGGVRWRPLVSVAVLALIVGVGYTMSGDATPNYTCTSMVPDLLAISEENQNAIVPVKMIDVVEIKTDSATEDRVECRGLAIMSNGLKGNVKYRAYVEYDKWWVQYEPFQFL